MFVKDIFDVDPSKISADDHQSLDLNKKFRPHIILAKARLHTNDYLYSVVPVQTAQPNTLYTVEIIRNSRNNLDNDSWVLCPQILSVKASYF